MRTQKAKLQARTGKHDIFRTIQAGRSNKLFEFITDFLFALSSYPSFIIEVFLRKKFGERYFTTATAIVVFILMLWLKYIANKFNDDLLGITWILFAFVFLGQSIRHRLEIRKYGTAYDFQRFSHSHGEILPFWWQLIGKEVWGIKIKLYHVFAYLEPAIPICVGLVLMLLPFTLGVGLLIFFSGLLFAFRSFMKLHYARGVVLDEIDEQIIMEAKHDVLVEEKPMSETKGLSFPIQLPDDDTFREKFCNKIGKQDDIWDDDYNEDFETDDLKLA